MQEFVYLLMLNFKFVVSIKLILPFFPMCYCAIYCVLEIIDYLVESKGEYGRQDHDRTTYLDAVNNEILTILPLGRVHF